MTTTLDKFEQCIQHAIPAYDDKEEIIPISSLSLYAGIACCIFANCMLKNEIKTLKEENNKLKHGMSEKKHY